MDPDLAWLHWYAGIGAFITLAGMWFHMTRQECTRSEAHHLLEGLMLWLLWPVLVVGVILVVIVKLREHRRDHHDDQ